MTSSTQLDYFQPGQHCCAQEVSLDTFDGDVVVCLYLLQSVEHVWSERQFSRLSSSPGDPVIVSMFPVKRHTFVLRIVSLFSSFLNNNSSEPFLPPELLYLSVRLSLPN